MADTEILLESGTNEIEIMQFTVFGELYGINVAKVREIIPLLSVAAYVIEYLPEVDISTSLLLTVTEIFSPELSEAVANSSALNSEPMYIAISFVLMTGACVSTTFIVNVFSSSFFPSEIIKSIE